MKLDRMDTETTSLKNPPTNLNISTLGFERKSIILTRSKGKDALCTQYTVPGGSVIITKVGYISIDNLIKYMIIYLLEFIKLIPRY